MRQHMKKRPAAPRRIGHGLLAVALIAGVAVVGAPMADADRKQDIADCREGDGSPTSFAICCGKVGGHVALDKDKKPVACGFEDGEIIGVFSHSPVSPPTKPLGPPPVVDQDRAPEPSPPAKVPVAPGTSVPAQSR
jgi:hypothetical protein